MRGAQLNTQHTGAGASLLTQQGCRGQAHLGLLPAESGAQQAEAARLSSSWDRQPRGQGDPAAAAASQGCTRGKGTSACSPSPGSAARWALQRSSQHSSSSAAAGLLPAQAQLHHFRGGHVGLAVRVGCCQQNALGRWIWGWWRLAGP